MGNFCTQCGNPLESEDVSFCTYCGARIGQDAPNAAASVGAATAAGAAPVGAGAIPAGYTMPASSLDGGGFAGGSAQAPGTQPMPATSVAPVATAPVQQQDSSVKTGVIIGVIAGAILALIIVLVAFHPWDSGSSNTVTTDLGSTSQSTNDDGGESGSTTTDDGSDSEAADDADETDYYDDLMSYYGAMPGYDQEIADCATYFNYNYTKSDYGVRQSGADQAASIHERISTDLSNLESLNVSSDNPYYTDWQNMIELQTDLLHRIEVIDQAWQNSLSYSNPADHVDSIIAPLTADNVDGVNKYKTHYVNNYSSWAPSQK